MNIYSLAATALLVIAFLIYKSVRSTAVHGPRFVKEAVAPANQIGRAVATVAEAIAGRIGARQKEIDSLRQTTTLLTLEIERLKAQRISVDQIRPIFELALLSVPFTYKHFALVPVRTTPSTTTAQREEYEYLAAWSVKYSQKLGVDFQKLRFQIVSPEVIAVTGLGETELIGVKDLDVKCEKVELRRHLTEGSVRGNQHLILEGDFENLKFKEHENQLSAIHHQINEQKEIEHIDHAIANMVMAFLAGYFSPAGYRLVKASADLADAKTFREICEEINQMVDAKMRHQTALLEATEGRCLAIQSLVSTEAKSVHFDPSSGAAIFGPTLAKHPNELPPV